MTAFVVVLTVGAVARLTRLAVADKITERPRRWLAERAPSSRAAYFVTCPWCVSVWVGAGVAVSAVEWGSATWWQAATVTLLASHVAGLVAEWETR